MRGALSNWFVGLFIGLGASLAVGAGATGCVDADPPAMRTLVTVISTQDGQAVAEATQRLCEYGRRALVVIEAALHTATPPGRRRLLRAARQLGDEDAVPLLAHIARYDEAEEVRKEALSTLQAWAADTATQRARERAAAATRALAVIH